MDLAWKEMKWNVQSNNDTAEKGKSMYNTLPPPVICSGFPAPHAPKANHE